MNLLAYIQGKRKGKEAHHIEKEAMQDPFLADALEGFDTVKADHIKQINLIRSRLPLVTAHSSGKKRMLIGIAASLLLCLSIGGYFLWEKSPNQLIALNDHAVSEEIAPSAGVVNESELSRRNQGYAENKLAQADKQAALQAETKSPAETPRHDVPMASPAIATPPPPPPPASPVEQRREAIITEEASETQVVAERAQAAKDILPVATDSAPFVARKKETAPAIVRTEAANMALKAAQQEEAKAASASQVANDKKDTQAAPAKQAVNYQKDITDLSAMQAVNQDAEMAKSAVPQPVTGMEAYEKYLKEAKISPTKDECPQTSGAVEIKFTLKTGKPTDFVILQSLCPAADKEAIRLIENGCLWIGTDGQTAIIKVTF